ncbi:MAG: hypothetical protein NC124_02025 [Clostridium sp.]|nr:hypothetical protein [Clostridium sp.]
MDSTINTINDYVIEYHQNGTQWYRKYKSGWIEQGGYINEGTSYGDVTVNLVTSMPENNYTIDLSPMGGSWDYAWYVSSMSTKQVALRCRFGKIFKWTVKGR